MHFGVGVGRFNLPERPDQTTLLSLDITRMRDNAWEVGYLWCNPGEGAVMSWDRKRAGPASGYYYVSKRVPGKHHPVKVYCGRGSAGHEAAAEVERRRADRREAKQLIQAEQDLTEEADRLAVELREWAEVLLAAWMILAGHYHRRGEWRRRPDG